MSVEGNEKVNEVANEAAENAGVRRCPERFTSLAHVARTISKRKWNAAKHWFRVENDRRPPSSQGAMTRLWRTKAERL